MLTLRWRAGLDPTRVFGLTLIAVHLVLTAVRLGRSWWWQDDLYMFGLVADRSLTPGLLFADYNGHLQPASWLMAWLVAHLAPFAWWPAALVQLALVAAIDLTLLALLRRMFGTRPAILVPLAMFCATNLTINATLWWAAGMQWLPTTLSLALCLYFHVGFLTTGDRRQALGAILSLVGGLLFFEKALTALAVLAFVTLAYDTTGRWVLRPVRALRRHPVYWGSFTLLAAGYLALYVSRTIVETVPARSAGQVLELVRETVLHAYVPGLFGGPLRWSAMPGSPTTWPNPTTTVVWISAVLGALLVLGSLWAGRRARRKGRRDGTWPGPDARSLGVRNPMAAWVLLLSFLGLSIALVARARLGLIGPLLGRDHRYVTDAALIGPLALALAWLPLRVTAAANPRPSTVPATPVTTGGAGTGGARPPRWRGLRLVAGTVFVLTVTTCGALSGQAFLRTWSQNPGAGYVDNLRDDLAAAREPVAMFDQPVPESMMMRSFENNGAMLSHVTKPMADRPHFVTWAPAVKVVDDRGHLRDAEVRGVTAPGTPMACGGPRVTRTLPAAPIAWAWKLEIVYTANRDSTAQVTLDDDGGPGARAVPVRLTAGMHKLYVSVVGGGDQVTLSGLQPGVLVCLGEVSVGQIQPAR